MRKRQTAAHTRTHGQNGKTMNKDDEYGVELGWIIEEGAVSLRTD